MILCDIDGVLATGPVGDTTVGSPIYRTCRTVPEELQRIRDADIPFHVVTARVHGEAVQVLKAVEVDWYVESIISADRLFWPTVWKALRRGRLPPGISKSVYSPLLPNTRGGPVVMIENHGPHLQDMLDADVIDVGILVPPIQVEDGRVVQWFDLELALRLARELATGGGGSSEVRNAGISIVPMGIGRHLFRLPRINQTTADEFLDLEALHTGHVLRRGRPTVVSMVRAGRRFVRRIRRLAISGTR